MHWGVCRFDCAASVKQAHMLDELDAANVQVVLCISVQNCLAVYTVRCDAGVPIQLRAAPNKRQKLVIIQSPHPMRACWLQPAAFNQGL